jgi:hypothetical protein
MSTRNHSIDQIDLTWQGLDFKPGVVQGTFVSVSWANDAFTVKANGMGGITRTFHPANNGTVTVTVDGSTKLHQQLWKLHESDRITRQVVGPMRLFDNSIGDTVLLVNTFITQPPEPIGNESENPDYTWTFQFERRVVTPNDGNNNVAGV